MFLKPDLSKKIGKNRHNFMYVNTSNFLLHRNLKIFTYICIYEIHMLQQASKTCRPPSHADC